MAIYKRRNLGDSLAGFMLKERNIYGSSMIGTSYDTLEMIGAHLDTVNAFHHLGNKNFFLENHLGNVLATVSDKKIPRFTNGILDHYEADIISSTDYYGFGQEEEGRNFNSKASRYGFNGKMKDNEVEGEGDVYDYGARMLDVRLGRFLSVDPLTGQYPFYTPYQYAGNKPIQCIDLDGLEDVDYRVLSISENGTAIVQVNVTANTTSRSNGGVLMVHNLGDGSVKTSTKSDLLNQVLGINSPNASGQNPNIVEGIGGTFTPKDGSSEYYLSLKATDISATGVKINPSDEGNYVQTVTQNGLQSKSFVMGIPPDPAPQVSSPTINLTPPGVAGYSPDKFSKTVDGEVNKLVSQTQQDNSKITNIVVEYPNFPDYQSKITDLTSKFTTDYPNAKVSFVPTNVKATENVSLNITVTGSSEQKLKVE